MSLKQHVKIQTPIVWVVTDEAHRAIEEVVDASTRPVYHLDALRGLQKYNPDKGEWIIVLVTAPDGSQVPCYDPQVAMIKVLDEHGVLIMENAHFSAEKMVPFYSAISKLYLDAVRRDDADKVPAQFILVSCKDEVPVEISRETFRVKIDLPTPSELRQTLGTVIAPDPAEVDIARVVRAGQGLSEFEFINALMRSTREKRCIDPDFINHLKIETIKSGGLLEIRTPTLTMDDIGGLDRLKDLMSYTAWTWANPEQAKALQVEPLRRMLLVGVPGSGKSAVCEASASLLHLDLAKTGASATMSKWVGESEANMRRVFTQVRAMEPIVLWIDEFGRDMSGSQSSGSVDGGTTDRVHGEFLTGLQELPAQVFLVCAANRIDTLPPEMTRADRFDKIVFVGLPSRDERADIFRIHLGASAADHNIDTLADQTLHYTGAEIKALVKEARFRAAAVHRRAPTTDDITALVPQLKGRIWRTQQEAVIEMYKQATEHWEFASSEQERDAERIISGAASAHASHTHAHKPVETGAATAGL